MRVFLTALTVVSSAALCGCATYTELIAPPRPTTAAERNFESLWQASLQTLRKYYFNIDRQDRRAGLIRTAPMVARQWFEFWRHDAVTSFNLAEDSLQTIYLTAEVTIHPIAPGAETYAASVKVTVARSDRPSPQLTSVSEAYQMFVIPGESRSKYLLDYGLTEEGDVPEDTVKLGRDKNLEAKLTAEIRRAGGR